MTQGEDDLIDLVDRIDYLVNKVNEVNTVNNTNPVNKVKNTLTAPPRKEQKPMHTPKTTPRRNFLAAGAGAAAALAGLSSAAPSASPPPSAPAIPSPPRLRVTGVELLPVRATARTVWLMVRLHTDAGLTGLGEASDAFGFLQTTREDAVRMESELRNFFRLIEGQSPFDIEAYRQRGMPVALKEGFVSATAFSAIEQALWDLAGKALGVPTYTLFGGKVRDTLPTYANVNRAARPRTPEGFAAVAKAAVADGFRAVKAAPWDGFPKPGSPASEIEAAVQSGIASTIAMREAIGPDIELMVDCHGFFDVAMAERVARALEPQNLSWYEEPVMPEQIAETIEIKRRIKQPMAAGELLFAAAGFAPLCRSEAVAVIMPDVKHCGGLLELTRIAALADVDGVSVAPHNPSGPVCTVASAQTCAGLKNFRLLELQWGEVGWRGELLDPPETFTNSAFHLSDRPGFGVELNDRVAREHPI